MKRFDVTHTSFIAVHFVVLVSTYVVCARLSVMHKVPG